MNNRTSIDHNSKRLSIINGDTRLNILDESVKLKYKDKLQMLKLAHNSVHCYQTKLNRESEKKENEKQIIEEENESNESYKSTESFNSDKSLDVDELNYQKIDEGNKKSILNDKNSNCNGNILYKRKSTLSNTNANELRNKFKVNNNKNSKTTD